MLLRHRHHILRCAPGLLVALLVAPLQARELIVSVAVSLQPAVEDVAARYRVEFPNVDIVLGTGASGVLLQQLLRGAPADVFLCASPVELDRLETEGLLASGTRRDVASNRLVILLPPGTGSPPSLDDLRREEFGLIAVGNPATAPVGRYTREALVALELAADVDDRLVPGESARQIVTWVQRGEVSAGLGYRTDALLFADRVRLGPELPAKSHSPIVYQAAVLAGSGEPEAARRFVDLLVSPSGRRVLERHGFLPPP